MRRGPEPGKIYPLDADTISIGRGSKNHIIIHDNEVSRNHVRLSKTPVGYELHDLNSSNGTYVNGQKVVEEAWLIQTQCIIELGDSITLEYRMGRPEDDPDVSEIYKSRSPTPIKEKSYLIISIDSRPDHEVYPLEGMTVNVGRSTSNDIVIVEPELSREHFRLTLMPQGYFVEDLGSTNGTFVNGEPLSGQRLLYTNDVIQIGTTIRLTLSNSPDMDRAVTSALDGESAPADKRKTSRLHAFDLSRPAAEPTDAGTGVDHKSLEDAVLISYARQDWEKIVAPLVDKLVDAEIESWVDQYLVERSSDWILATEQARLECWLLIIVVSPAAMKSDLVQRNWRHFQNREKPVILVILEPADRMPMGASLLPTVQYNPAVPDVAFQQLIREIKRIQAPPQVDTKRRKKSETDSQKTTSVAAKAAETGEADIVSSAAAADTSPAEPGTVVAGALTEKTSADKTPTDEVVQDKSTSDQVAEEMSNDADETAEDKSDKRPAKPLLAALEAARNARTPEPSNEDIKATLEQEGVAGDVESQTVQADPSTPVTEVKAATGQPDTDEIPSMTSDEPADSGLLEVESEPEDTGKEPNDS